MAQSGPVTSFFLRKKEERTLPGSPVARLELKTITIIRKIKGTT